MAFLKEQIFSEIEMESGIREKKTCVKPGGNDDQLNTSLKLLFFVFIK